jgi:hypothetical protein
MLEQCGLPNTALASEHERPAATLARASQKLLEPGALTGTPNDHAAILSPAQPPGRSRPVLVANMLTPRAAAVSDKRRAAGRTRWTSTGIWSSARAARQR